MIKSKIKIEKTCDNRKDLDLDDVQEFGSSGKEDSTSSSRRPKKKTIKVSPNLIRPRVKPIKDLNQIYEPLAIVEKYEKVISYLYPVAQSMKRQHGVARDMFLNVLLSQPDLFYQAAKSNQVSKIYAADAGLATIRFWLRFLVRIRSLSPKQLQTSQILIAEVGSILGSWLKRKQGGLGK